MNKFFYISKAPQKSDVDSRKSSRNSMIVNDAILEIWRHLRSWSFVVFGKFKCRFLRWFGYLSFLFFLCYFQTAFSFAISQEHANKIGERIWKNECAGSMEGLTNWKEGENFASFGIGHFIWYSHNNRERFKETFPDLLIFLQQNGVSLPDWLKELEECPWNSREQFYKNIHSSKMNSLRQFLFDTKSLQATFMANRLEQFFLEQFFMEILQRCSKQESIKIATLLSQILEDTNGLYALIDYLNFKGEGTCPTETYKGQGWGLLQVLQKMPDSSEYPLLDFVQAAKTVLSQRVKNSPPQRHEAQWLKGWFNRLDTYLIYCD